MAFSKALLLKCLGGGGVATLAVAGGTTIFTSRDKGDSEEKESLKTVAKEEKTTVTDKELVDEVGLNCGDATENNTFNDGTECSLKNGGSINIQQGNEKEEGITSTSGKGKIKLYKEDKGDYNQKLRFTVESGDITLSKTDGDLKISKLNRYESYEIKKGEENKYYLNRKREVDAAIETLLGLPENCKLSSGSCSSLSEGDLEKINFHEKEDGEPTTTGTATLTITKEANKAEDFPLGYKFALQANGDEISFSKFNKIKDGKQSEFRIRQEEEKETLSLEEFWTADSLAEKSGLDCGESITDGAVCNPKDEDNKISFKLDEKKVSAGIDLLAGGKLKVYKNQKDYRGGLKFVVEGGDISDLGGNDNKDNKLEEFETYELEYYEGIYRTKEDGTKPLYISRKTKKSEEIQKKLGLPESCKFPEKENDTTDCESLEIKNINFREKSSSATGSLSLTITKMADNSPEYPFGYKFTFKAKSENIKVSLDNEITTEGVEFKIGREGMKLFLERNWNIDELAKKLRLNCTGNNNENCSLDSSSSGKLNIKQGTKNIENVSSLTMNSGKIKLEKNKMEYGFGFKFTIEGGDITINNGSDKLKQYETYEIKEEKDKWYLVRKSTSGVEIGSKLSLPKKCEFPEDDNTEEKTCELDSSEFSKVNFDGKGGSKGGAAITQGEKITLRIKKDTSLSPEYKFIFETGPNTEADVPISSGSNLAKLRKNTKLEFKIKKEGDDLKLEKRYTITSFTTGGNSVSFLSYCNGDESSEQQCTLTGEISVYNDSDNYFVDATARGSNPTLSFEDGYEGYEKGFRFKTNSDITLTKNGNNKYSEGSESKILKGKWYEIKQHEITNVTNGKKWFLYKHS